MGSFITPSVIKYGYSYQRVDVVGNAGDVVRFPVPNMAATREVGMNVQGVLTTGTGNSIQVAFCNATANPAEIDNTNLPWATMVTFTSGGIQYLPGPFLLAQVSFIGTGGQVYFTLTS